LVTQIDALRSAVRQARLRAPFHIDAWVVLPDQMHCLWTLPEGDAIFPGRWRAIKTAFSKSVPTGEPRLPVISSRGERGIWQRRFWEHTIRNDQDFASHMDYTHFNPVKHGLVEHPADWLHSSFRRCMASGLYPAGGWAVATSRERRGSGGEIAMGDKRKGRSAQPSPALVFRGLQPAGLRTDWRAADGGSRRNALRFSALRSLKLF
jgi:putative transposase